MSANKDEIERTKEKSGLADVMSKILNKSTPENKKSVILSKARTDKQVLKAKLKRKQNESDDSGTDDDQAKKQKVNYRFQLNFISKSKNFN